jgi:predicted RNase H-like nuclease (RuvC/YqgF family)
MKKIIFLALVAFCAQGFHQNEELRLRFKILNDWISRFRDQGKVDLDQVQWFKFRIDRLLNVLQECDLQERAEVLAGVWFYLERILSVVKGQGMLDGVGPGQVEEVIGKVKELGLTGKNIESGVFEKYQNLNHLLSSKTKSISKLSSENSDLSIKISKISTQITKSESILQSLKDKQAFYQEQIDQSQSSHQSHLKTLQTTLQSQSSINILKEKSELNIIQTSQDTLISKLQIETEQSSLKIQQISAEIIELEGKIEVYSGKISRLERDLYAKGAELIRNENKFEEFRGKVEESVKNDLERIKNSEK